MKNLNNSMFKHFLCNLKKQMNPIRHRQPVYHQNDRESRQVNLLSNFDLLCLLTFGALL